MLKYRLLTDEELKVLEHEFKQFLIVNEIYDEEWRKLNAENSKKVDELIVLFSNLVIEKSLKKIMFLELVTEEGIKTFHYKENEAILIGITSAQKNINFLTVSTEKLTTAPLKIYSVTKKYEASREEEVFKMLQSGAGIIDEQRFRQLELAYEYSTQKKQN